MCDGIRRCGAVVRDLLFPPRCATCGELLPPFAPDSATTVLCPACRDVWDEARITVAESAARSAVDGHAYLVDYHSGQVDGIAERFIFHLKHEGDTRAFAFAAKALSPGVHVALLSANRGMIAPSVEVSATEVDKPLAPLFTYPPRRRAAIQEDGFDQAKCLSRALAREMNGEWIPLLRRRGTREMEQKRLDAESRAENAARAYALQRGASDRLRGRTVVLCDDLATTGATLVACSALLCEAGARRVLWVTVAKTVNGR